MENKDDKNLNPKLRSVHDIFNDEDDEFKEGFGENDPEECGEFPDEKQGVEENDPEECEEFPDEKEDVEENNPEEGEEFTDEEEDVEEFPQFEGGEEFTDEEEDYEEFPQFRNAAGEGSGHVPRKAAAIENKLLCSLEDLYKGTTKKIKISRNVNDSFGRPTTVDEILITIEIKPGWKKGTRITFREMGNLQRGVIPGDLVFIIDEKPHSLFKRYWDYLFVTQEISLVEALTGYTVQLTTLDGRNLTIPINSIITPTYQEVVKGEGMPLRKEPSKKGDLRIKFNIKFPSGLTSEQISGIKQLLAPP